MKLTIVVHVDSAGASKMIDHILDGSLAEYNPSVTVDGSRPEKHAEETLTTPSYISLDPNDF